MRSGQVWTHQASVLSFPPRVLLRPSGWSFSVDHLHHPYQQAPPSPLDLALGSTFSAAMALLQPSRNPTPSYLPSSPFKLFGSSRHPQPRFKSVRTAGAGQPKWGASLPLPQEGSRKVSCGVQKLAECADSKAFVFRTASKEGTAEDEVSVGQSCKVL